MSFKADALVRIYT